MTERLRASGPLGVVIIGLAHSCAAYSCIRAQAKRGAVGSPSTFRIETDRPNYSLHAQQSIHFPQQEPALAVHPQLQEQHDLPQQQVELCVVSDMSDIA